MSNVFVRDIIGSGIYGVPASDAALASATAGFDTLISGIADLDYDRVYAWVETRSGVGAPRILNCLVENFAYGATPQECTNATGTEDLTDDIKATLEGNHGGGNVITSIGDQQVHLHLKGEYYLWKRNSASGFLYPNWSTDDIAVGGSVPDGKWFNDGDMVLGAALMSGTETLYVVGSERLEGRWLMTEQSSTPIAPTTTEGTFWVWNTTPTLPGFTDDAGVEQTLAYADTDTTSLQGIDQIIFVDKTSGVYVADGTIQLPYNTIGAAIVAATALTPGASNRITIVIYPGVYVEAVVTADDYVDFVGLDKQSTIIRQTGSNSPLEIQNANIIFRNLTFEAASGCTDYIVDVSVAITDRVVFFDCDFLGTNGSQFNYFKSTYGNIDFYRCRLIQGDTAAVIFDDSQATARTNRFFDCELSGVVNLQASMDVEAYASRFYATADSGGFYGALRIGGTTPDRSFLGCEFSNGSSSATAHCVYFNATARDVWFLGCRFESGDNATADISGSADCNPVVVKDCWMKKGMDRRAKMTTQAVKWCNGAAGDYDYYVDFDEAVQAITTAGSDVDCQIVFLDDFANAGTVSVPGTGRKFVVNGQSQFGITGASQIFMQTAGSDIVKFMNIDIEGEAQLVGNTSMLIFDTCKVSGALRVSSGDSSSKLIVHDSAVRGSSDFVNPIDIRDADPTIIIWTSYLIGHTGNAAVSYNSSVDNDNLKIAYSKIYHGSLGSNNPFTGITSTTQAVYDAHHTAFNVEPDVSDSTHYLNNIDTAQRKNTIDPDGNYTWWPA